MVSIRFSSSSLAVLAVFGIVLLSTTTVVVIAQSDEMMMSSNNVTTVPLVDEVGEEIVEGDDFIDIDLTNTTDTEVFDVLETDLEVDVFDEEVDTSMNEGEEDMSAVGISNITQAPSEVSSSNSPTFVSTWEATTWSPTVAAVTKPTITLGPKPTPSPVAAVAADSAEPGFTDPVMSVSGAASSSSIVVGVIVSAAVATSMIVL
jgi:hypothetical protein